MVELLVDNGKDCYLPAVEEGIEWTLERKGQAGMLTFRVVMDDLLDIQEGNRVRLTVDGTPLFYGFVFTRKWAKERVMDILAYDQLRYLVKNKDTRKYEGQTASTLLRQIAGDYRLSCGTLEDTGLVIESRLEENQSLMDIFQNALDATLRETKELYVLYDDFGKLTLRNVQSMRLDLLLDAQTGENFDFESSIDRQTYNQIKLAYDNHEIGVRQLYVAKDSQHINDWGVLQYFESLQSPLGAEEKANALLGLYNQKTESLHIQNALGDVRVRPGSTLVVALELGDGIATRIMMVSSVKHTFKEGEHWMDLNLIGGEFIA